MRACVCACMMHVCLYVSVYLCASVFSLFIAIYQH